MRHVQALAVFLAFLNMIPRVCPANTFDILGFSPRSIAMGGAYTAVGGDEGSLYHNPAGLGQLHSSSFLLSPLWDFPRFSARPASRQGGALPALTLDFPTAERNSRLISAASGPDTVSGTTIGLALKAGHHFGFGLAMYLPGRPNGRHFLDFNVIKYRFFDSYTPYDLQQNRMDRLIILPAAGLRILDGLSVGAGTSVLGNATSEFVTTIPLSPDKDVRIVSDLDIPPIASPFAGILYSPIERLSLGLTYRDEIKLRVKAAAKTEVSIGIGSLQFPVWIPLQIDAVTHYTPRQVVLGTAAHLLPEVLVTGELTWAQWSKYVPPFPKITGIDEEAFQKIPEMLRPQLPFVPPVEPAHFKNTLVPRLGTEWSPSKDLSFRAGSAYEPSPVPDQKATSNILDSDRLHLTGGAAYHIEPNRVLRYPMRLDAFILYTRLQPRTFEKNLDNLRDEDAEKEGIQTTNPGYPGITYSGNALALGISAAFEF
ncbi:MAG: outer membrane protein transport protein [Nitrospirae bacterium]|nr:outer membrane protein transport protein [Nitrospirota bacterium]